MSTQKQAAAKRPKMAERAQLKFERLFPGCDPLCLWRRKLNDGYSTMPRTLPYLMQAIDNVSKGTPAGHTLFCLWARSPDHPLVTIENPAVFAAEAGFNGERAVDTWRRRMKQLVKLNVLWARKSAVGDFHNVLLLNPNVVMEHMYQSGLVQQDLYERFSDRLSEIGGSSDVTLVQAQWNARRALQAAAVTPPVVAGTALPAVPMPPAAALTSLPGSTATTPLAPLPPLPPLVLPALMLPLPVPKVPHEQPEAQA